MTGINSIAIQPEALLVKYQCSYLVKTAATGGIDLEIYEDISSRSTLLKSARGTKKA